MTEKKIPYKIYLEESEMPRTWYNVRADMKNKPAPLRNPATGGWRLIFTVRLPKEDGVIQSLMSARKGPVMLRFRALLKKGENLPDPLTDTWIYDWQLQPQ